MCRPAFASSSSSANNVAAFLLVLLAASRAHAHLGDDVLAAERLLKVDVDRAQVRVVVSLSLGPEDARTIFRAADADRDHAITADEADSYLEVWSEALGTELPITLDGATPTIAWGDAYFDPLGPIRVSRCTIELVGTIALEAGAHTLTLTDHMGVERYERTDVVFVARTGARLLASGLGAHPTAIDSLAYSRVLPSPDGLFSARFEVAGLPQSQRKTPPWLLVLGGVVLALISALSYRRLRAGTGNSPRT